MRITRVKQHVKLDHTSTQTLIKHADNNPKVVNKCVCVCKLWGWCVLTLTHMHTITRTICLEFKHVNDWVCVCRVRRDYDRTSAHADGLPIRCEMWASPAGNAAAACAPSYRAVPNTAAQQHRLYLYKTGLIRTIRVSIHSNFVTDTSHRCAVFSVCLFVPPL